MTSIRIAIIGAGPSGCYVAEQLNKSLDNTQIDFFDQSPFPYGLVRTGVAPDHGRMKNLATYFEKILSKDNVRFFGNVRIGDDISVEELRSAYQVLFICTGASIDKRVPALPEDKAYYTGSSTFVKWYNGHLRTEVKSDNLGSSIGILGMGNVAMDVARILLKNKEQLAPTEIPNETLELIQDSNVKDVHIFVRRGPLQMACTQHELNDLLSLEHVDVHIDNSYFNLSDEQKQILTESKSAQTKFDTLIKAHETKKDGTTKHLHIHFFRQVSQIDEKDNHITFKVEKTALKRDGDQLRAVGQGDFESYDLNFLVSSIGYVGEGLAGIPFDEKNGVIPNEEGSVIGAGDWLYTAGWVKRGAQGVIGTNRGDAKETVARFLSDLEQKELPSAVVSDIEAQLKAKGTDYFTFDDWLKIDKLEKDLGQKEGKTRKKFMSVEEIKHGITRI